MTTSVTNSNETGNAILSQLTGTYDGTLDVPTVVDSLLYAETGIALNSLNSDISEFKDKQTAFQLLQSGLNGFGGLMSQIQSGFQNITTSTYLGDPSIAEVSVSDDVAVGSYSFEVLNLASKQSTTSMQFGSSNELVGSGTLTIETGNASGAFLGNGDAVNITISAGMTVDDVISEINASGAGVTAYLVNTSTGVQVAMTSKQTGLSNGFNVTVTDSDGNNGDNVGLSAFSYNDAFKNMNSGQLASDAQVLLDGVLLNSSTNVFNDTINGFDFTVKKVNAGAPTVLDVSPDVQGARDLLDEFVMSYNSVIEVFEYLKSEELGEDSQGALFRDPDLKLLEESFKDIANQYVSGFSGSGALGQLGVRFTDQNNYTIEVDDELLTNVLDANPDAIKNSLTQLVTSSNPNVSFVSATDNTVAGDYSPVTVTQLSSSAQITGGASTSLIIDGLSDEFSLTVNGESTGLIAIPQQTYADYNQLATAIQTAINNNLSDNTVSVTHDGSGFVIDGLVEGSTSVINWDSSEAGFATATGITAGLNGVGSDLVANVGGEVAIGTGNVIEVLTGDLVGLKLKINAATTGDYGSVTVSDGIAKSFGDWVDNNFTTDGLFQTILSNYESRISDKEERISALEERTEVLRVSYSQKYSEINSFIISMQQTQAQLEAQFESWNSN